MISPCRGDIETKRDGVLTSSLPVHTCLSVQSVFSLIPMPLRIPIFWYGSLTTSGLSPCAPLCPPVAGRES
jgi:hypothetical protein